MKKTISIIAIYIVNISACIGQNNDIQIHLSQNMLRFEEEISSINRSECNSLYKCYADTSLKSNSGIVISEGIVKLFEDFRKNPLFDSVFILDSNNNLRCTHNSIYLRILKSLSKEEKYYEAYLNVFNEFGEISPPLASGLNYFISTRDVLFHTEKEFLFLHYAAVYYMSTP